MDIVEEFMYFINEYGWIQTESIRARTLAQLKRVQNEPTLYRLDQTRAISQNF